MTRRLVAGLAMALAFGSGGVATGAIVYASDVDRCSSGCDHTGALATSMTRDAPSRSDANGRQGAGKGAEDDLGDVGHASGWDLDAFSADIDEPGDGVFAPTLDGLSEPASWALMIVGVGMVGAGLRLRRKDEVEFV